MAHKVLVGGTGYTVKGGKVLVGGTGYAIKDGKTLVGGTGYKIPFHDATFAQIMAKATLDSRNGRDRSSAGTISLTTTKTGTFYVFTLINGYMDISKVARTSSTAGTVTRLNGNPNSSVGPYLKLESTTIYVYKDAALTTRASVYGGSIFAFTVSTYTAAQIDEVLSDIKLTRIGGRNQSSKGSVYGTAASGTNVISAASTYLGMSNPLGTVIYGNHSSNPSLVKTSGTTVYTATSATTDTWYGGSLVSWTE